MRVKFFSAVVVAGAAVAATVTAASPAGASGYLFVGYAGGTIVHAANQTVTSDLTAASNLNTTATTSDTNSTASLTLPSVLTAGAVETSTSAKAVSGGYEVVSESRLAKLNVLNGAITADAVDTTTTSSVVNGQTQSTSNTTFVGLRIPGIYVPATVPANFAVNIPGIATVILNYKMTAGDASTKMMTIGMGLYVGLLRTEGPNAAGASVQVNTTYAALGPLVVPPSKHYISASSYGTTANVHAGNTNVRSDPTAPNYLAAGGTDGKTQSVSVASVNLGSAATVGGVVDTVAGTNTATRFDATSSSKVAGINLFGLVKAQAITATAHAYGTTTADRTATGSSQLVNLVIGGRSIPINTAPNTRINVLGLGTVTINQQIKSDSHTITVRGLDIVLGQAKGSFPAGAEIQVAVATAAVN